MSASLRRSDAACVAKLWSNYLRTRSVALRNRLVDHYRSIVHAHGARLAQKLPAQITFDEICSAGYDGLIAAVEAYNPDKKAKFETFCQRRINGAVMDWLRDLDPQSRIVRFFEKRRATVKDALDSRVGRPATDDELARDMRVSRGRYKQMMRLSHAGHAIHLSAVQCDNDRGHRSAIGWDVQDRSSRDPSEKVGNLMFTEYVTRGLNPDERFVIVLYYYEGLTMSEIGRMLGLSESRVSQIHKEVLQRMRKRLFDDDVREMVA